MYLIVFHAAFSGFPEDKPGITETETYDEAKVVAEALKNCGWKPTIFHDDDYMGEITEVK